LAALARGAAGRLDDGFVAGGAGACGAGTCTAGFVSPAVTGGVAVCALDGEMNANIAPKAAASKADLSCSLTRFPY
jgi:hypothetical protein